MAKVWPSDCFRLSIVISQTYKTLRPYTGTVPGPLIWVLANGKAPEGEAAPSPNSGLTLFIRVTSKDYRARGAVVVWFDNTGCIKVNWSKLNGSEG